MELAAYKRRSEARSRLIKCNQVPNMLLKEVTLDSSYISFKMLSNRFLILLFI